MSTRTTLRIIVIALSLAAGGLAAIGIPAALLFVGVALGIGIALYCLPPAQGAH